MVFTFNENGGLTRNRREFERFLLGFLVVRERGDMKAMAKAAKMSHQNLTTRLKSLGLWGLVENLRLVREEE